MGAIATRTATIDALAFIVAIRHLPSECESEHRSERLEDQFIRYRLVRRTRETPCPCRRARAGVRCGSRRAEEFLTTPAVELLTELGTTRAVGQERFDIAPKSLVTPAFRLQKGVSL